MSSIFHPNDECGWEMALKAVYLIRNHQLGRLFSDCLFVSSSVFIVLLMVVCKKNISSLYCHFILDFHFTYRVKTS